MRRTIVLISTIAILLGADSCIKKNPNSLYDSNHRDYFSARFDNYFSPGETGLMIFLSDMSGNLLAEKSLSGNNSVYLSPAPGTLFPELLIETLVYTGPVVGDKSTVYLYSYLQVLPASWIWTTFQSENVGFTNLNFSNTPPQTAYSISSNFQWLHGGIMPNSLPINLGKNPDNVYILLNTGTNGYRYKWLTGVGNQNSYPVNLSSTDMTLSKTIPIPHTSSLSYQLSGYLPAGEHAKGLYTLDYGDQAGPAADSVTLHYPATVFSDFQFYINTIDPSDSRKQWYQYDFGMIPERIDHLEGNIVVLDSTPSHYRVQTSGTFDRLGSSWEFNPLGPYRYQWTVYGSPSATSFKFPALPSDLAAVFTGFSIDSLKLSSVEIKDFSGITTYDDLIKKMFVSGKYIADIVPKYSGLIYNMSPSKAGNKPSRDKSF
jgi:hypothetical protein